MTCAAFFALVFALSAALTFQIHRSAVHKQLLDIPNEEVCTLFPPHAVAVPQLSSFFSHQSQH